jgi:hypothetical protein
LPVTLTAVHLVSSSFLGWSELVALVIALAPKKGKTES